MTRLRADLLLLLGAFIWGTAFVAQKYANENMGPLLFTGIRFGMSTLVLAPLAWWEMKKPYPTPLMPRDMLLALVIGLCVFLGISMQQTAMITATVTNGGFLTSIYLAFVPFTTWLLQGQRPRPMVLLACAVSLLGAWLLTNGDAMKTWERGDILLLAGDIPWAFQITLVAMFLARTPRPLFLAFVQYAVTSFFGLVIGAVMEPVVWSGIYASAPAILYAGLLSGGVAYTLQLVGQRYTPPAEAALILSLEGVFAAIAGAVLLHERLTFLAAIGCALILLGILMVEIGPAVLARGKRAG